MKTWLIYFVNGYKFHAQSWNKKRKTFNYGIYVRGIVNVNLSEDDFYGILKEKIQLKYPSCHNKKLTFFSCYCFDPIMNHSMRVHPLYGIVKIKHNKMYPNVIFSFLPISYSSLLHTISLGSYQDKTKTYD